MTLSAFDGPTYATLTREDAYRLACDIIDLFQFPSALASPSPAPPTMPAHKATEPYGR
jgi:hypothetical protein